MPGVWANNGSRKKKPCTQRRCQVGTHAIVELNVSYSVGCSQVRPSGSHAQGEVQDPGTSNEKWPRESMDGECGKTWRAVVIGHSHNLYQLIRSSSPRKPLKLHHHSKDTYLLPWPNELYKITYLKLKVHSCLKVSGQKPDEVISWCSVLKVDLSR